VNSVWVASWRLTVAELSYVRRSSASRPVKIRPSAAPHRIFYLVIDK
jgi:hypothetical protein